MSRGLDSQAGWLGVDIGGTHIKWAVLHDGELAASGSVPTSRDGERRVATQVVGLINERAGEVRGAGVTVPGHVDARTGRTGIVPNLPGRWNGFPLGDTLAEATGQRVALLNDARAFALAELRLGAAADLSDAVFVAVGTGVGGAVALDGVLLGGVAGRVGEIGHIAVVPDGPVCGCGGRGCVDVVAGGAGLVAAAARLYGGAGPAGAAAGPHDGGGPAADRPHGPDPLSPAAVFAAATAGDARAAGVVREAGAALAEGVADACALLGIANVVLGGGLARQYPDLPAVVGRRLSTVAPLIGPALVRLSRFTDHAAAIGAALAAQPTHLENP
jgi:glucokinase